MDIKEIEKYIKIQEFDLCKFYVFSVKYDIPVDEINRIRDAVHKQFPDLKFMVLPDWIKLYGFEPTEDTKKHQLSDMVDKL